MHEETRSQIGKNFISVSQYCNISISVAQYFSIILNLAQCFSIIVLIVSQYHSKFITVL